MIKRFFLLIIFGLFLTGVLFADEVDVISPGDKIEVFVFDNRELSRQLSVKMDGSISLPLIGKIRAEGLTTHQLEEILEERISQYIRQPKASVIFVEHFHWVVYILGEVKLPGSYKFYEGMKVIDLIAQARGFTADSNLSNAVIIRKLDDGTRKRINLNLHRVLRGQKADIELQMKDIVYIPRTGLGAWNYFLRNILPSMSFIMTIITLSVML